jgi:MFS transporter, DHA3 family, macrolide efflux protein
MSDKKLTLREVFVNGNFFCLWLGQIVSQFGERLTQMALIGLIYQMGIVNTQEMSKLLFFMILPVFIFNPIAGVCVDRWDRKKTLVVCDILRCILTLLLPISYYVFNIKETHNMYPIYIIVFLVFSVSRFFMLAKTAIIPEVMEPKYLRAANSINSTTKMIATVSGVLLGGLIVSALGAVFCFYIDALTFAISATAIYFIKRKNIVEPDLKEGYGKFVLIKTEFIEGIKEIRKNRSILFLVKVLCVLMAGTGAIFVIFPVFVNKQFGAQANGLGVMVAALGAGLFVGALVLGKYMHKTSNKKMISVSVISVALLFIVLANLRNLMFAQCIMFLIGFVGLPVIVCAETLIHEMVEDKMIGRVYGAVEILIHTAFLISMAVTGFVGDIASPGFIFSILGASFAIIILVVITHEKIIMEKVEKTENNELF